MFKQRFSVNEVFKIFIVCSFPIHVWSIYNLLKVVPAWVIRMNAWELTAAVAYVMLFTLFESLLVYLGVMLVLIILPLRWVKNQSVIMASVIVLLASIGAIAMNVWGTRPDTWGRSLYIVMAIKFGASSSVVYFLVHRFSRIEGTIRAVVDRVTVLGIVCIF